MTHIVSTIPKSKFIDWAFAERICRMCDGTTLHAHGLEEPQEWFWLINVAALPSKIVPGESVCFMVFDGLIRGYFDIITTDESKNWASRHDASLVYRNTKCIVMANWHPYQNLAMQGFQGYRYTDLQP